MNISLRKLSKHSADGANRELSLFDLLMISITIISISSLLFLIGGSFRVDLVLISSLLAIILIVHFFYTPLLSKLMQNRHFIPIVILILATLFFRSEPYQYILGGQDEGIYVNMSKAFKQSGEVFQYDKIRQDIFDPDLRRNYDNTNIRYEFHKAKKFEGHYLGGIYVADSEQSRYVFQFYHLHPLWLAIFDGVFGERNAGYALVLFSLISILALYLLAYEMTGSRAAAFAAGALLAVNPLHAFFSKFPVTEVMALAFASSSFYYLLRYFNLTKQKIYRNDYLIISALLMAGMFFTRISGFMYIPFFYLLLILNQIYTEDGTARRALTLYFFGIFSLYALSVIYGLAYSYPYSSDIYQMSFGRFLGEGWSWKMAIFLAFLLLLYLYTYRLVASDQKREKIKKLFYWSKRALPFLYLTVLALGYYKIYQLGYTDRYINDAWINGVWKLNHIGAEAKYYWSAYVLYEYITPILAALFLLLILFRINTLNFAQTLLLLFLFFFIAYISVLQWKIPYQYYYARYLVSEALPYAILFIATGVTAVKYGKKLYYLLLIVAGLHAINDSTTQFQGSEADGVYNTIKRITQPVDIEDLILTDGMDGEIKMALVYYEDKNVVSISDENLDFVTEEILERYNDIYLLLWHPSKLDVWADERIFSYRFGLFEQTNHLPEKYYYIKKKLYRYKLDKEKWLKILPKDTHRILLKDPSLKKEGFFPESVWTTDMAKISGFDMNISDANYMKIYVYGGNRAYDYDPVKMGLEVFVNGKKVPFHSRKYNSLYFELDHQKSVNEVSIRTNTFKPKDFGIGNDSRDVGIDIISISFIKEIKQ
ncbi:MAG: glycosyltransferase family 39 protein [Campylobacterota bacterium]|nr:glycosyltransferase family 39 protein [Campylobacterota bacterium]